MSLSLCAQLQLVQEPEIVPVVFNAIQVPETREHVPAQHRAEYKRGTLSEPIVSRLVCKFNQLVEHIRVLPIFHLHVHQQ